MPTDPDELLDEWHDNNDRPAWVRARRADLMAHLSVDDAIPSSSLADIHSWLERYRSTVTRQLSDAVDGETDNTQGDE